ncbi:MAG: hypothetical protein ACLSHC_14160 [Bilophila wadsworthia]
MNFCSISMRSVTSVAQMRTRRFRHGRGGTDVHAQGAVGLDRHAERAVKAALGAYCSLLGQNRSGYRARSVRFRWRPYI